jgi:hypothetical protein
MTETHQIQFNNYLVEFIQKLKIIVPTEKKLFGKYYKYYRTFVDQKKRVDFIAEFVQYISKYNVEVSSCDEGLFSEEEGYYPGKPIQLMKGIDFKKLWKHELSDGSKESIWKYLQTLYIIGTFVLKETDKYNELLKKQQEIVYNLLQNMKYEKKIKDDAAQLNQTEEKNSQGSFDLSGLSELFDGDNIIFQIAMEIAKEINLPGEIGNDPISAISMLFSKDSSKLQEIIAKVGNKLTSVLKEKGLSEQDLLAQAKDMNAKILSKLKGIPGMPDIEQLSQNLAENYAAQAPTPNSSEPEKQQISEEQLKQCQDAIKESIDRLKENFNQMGVTDLDSFADNMESMLTQFKTGDDIELDKELENLKKASQKPTENGQKK